jgi:biopolymer transport protein TolQ
MGLISLIFLQLGPQPHEGPGILDFFLQAGPMAKFVLAVLGFFSIASWAVIVGKAVQLKRAERQSEEFLEAFHRSQRFSEVNALSGRLRTSPLVGIFQSGYAEIDSQIKSHSPEFERGDRVDRDRNDRGDRGERLGSERPPERRPYRITSLTSLERSLARAVSLETAGVTRWTGLLATTAAATPFIGLFGTVWGIMQAFSSIGATGSTSIVAVAPGIAEALVNTAAGLAAAIPALIAYNYFAQRIRRLRGRMEDFILEFLNLAERNFT